MKVNGERIKQARELSGLTQERLADKVEVSQPHISLIEQNADAPSERLVEAISLATGFPTSFFSRSSGPDFPLGSLLYRKKANLSSGEAARVRQLARIYLEVVGGLGERFKALPLSLPRMNCNPSEAAQLVRSNLGIAPDTPITGLLAKIEKAGVLVMYIPTSLENFDAFSAWTNGEVRRPAIFLKQFKAGDRIRRTLAHELGHLVLHQDFLGSPSELEKEANNFAAELLFPEEAMQNEVALPLTLTRLAELKSRWGVSLQSIAEWACNRSIINMRQKRYIFAKLNRRGWIKREPVPIGIEYPRYLQKLVEHTFTTPEEALKELSRSTSVSRSILNDLFSSNSVLSRSSSDLPSENDKTAENILQFERTRTQ